MSNSFITFFTVLLNNIPYYRSLFTSRISSFFSLFGTYKHDGVMLTSTAPGVETMLDSFPLFYELIKELANNKAANKDIAGILLETQQYQMDLKNIIKDIVTSTDPEKIEMAKAMRNIPKFDLGQIHLLSYHYVLSEILTSGFHLEYMSSVLEKALTENQKIMMELLRDTASKCRGDVSVYYGHKLKLMDTISQANNSGLMREVHALLENNPFNKPGN